MKIIKGKEKKEFMKHLITDYMMEGIRNVFNDFRFDFPDSFKEEDRESYAKSFDIVANFIYDNSNLKNKVLKMGKEDNDLNDLNEYMQRRKG